MTLGTPQFAQAWAKRLPEGVFLPLSDHGADAAAVLQALLAEPHWRRPVELVAGRALTAVDLTRLEALAFLHDLGKTNSGFWRRQFPDAPIVGHTSVCAALFGVEEPPVVALGETLAGWGAELLFIAVMAHHGIPLQTFAAGKDGMGLPTDVLDRISNDRRYWEPIAGYDPIAQLDRLLAAARSRFPLAFGDGPRLPQAPRFVSAVAGLMTLADWLGSDAALFPVGGPHGEAREAFRAAGATRAVSGRGLGAHATPDLTFETALGFPPRGPQLLADRIPAGLVALIEAETGSGKTEAALWHWLALRTAGLVDGLYFALPTRSAAVQLHARVQLTLTRVFGPGVIEAVLAVPGYLRAGDAEGQKLPGFDVLWPDDGVTDDGRWAAETPRQYLAARVAVGTVDQALMAGLKLKHAHLRAAALSRSLLVVDEVHASDTFMGEVLKGVIANHTAVGGRVLLLSATLGGEMRAALLNQPPPELEAALAAPYPALSGGHQAPEQIPESGVGKRVRWQAQPEIDDAVAVARRAIAAARHGAGVLVVRNSVAGAVAVARAAEAEAPELCFAVDGIRTLHHGRFSPDDRRLLDKAVEAALDPKRAGPGRILVGTQTLEQSLDIDADYLITDLAPVDVLLQRIGRLHRHAKRTQRGAHGEAQADILVPAERDLGHLFRRGRRDRHGLGPRSDGSGVYPDLLVIEATLRLIEADAEIIVPRDNRRLVEGALHSEVLDRLERELGAAWINHGAQQSGVRYADRLLAKAWRLDMGEDFDTLHFPVDEVVRTRIGGNDRLIEFADPPTGPFGKPVTRLTIPGWMASSVPPEAEPVVAETDDGFAFSLGDKRFAYSRYGLEALAND